MTLAATSIFNDPYPYQRAIRAAEVEAFVTGQGLFHAELTRIDLGRVWMQRARENLPRVLHYTTNGSRAPIIFLIDRDQAPMRHSGVKAGARRGDHRRRRSGAPQLHRRGLSLGSDVADPR